MKKSTLKNNLSIHDGVEVVMKRRPVSIEARHSLKTAEQLMKRRKAAVLIVQKQGKIVGTLDAAQFFVRSAKVKESADKIPVARVMKRLVLVAKVGQSVSEVLALMCKSRLPSMPVIDSKGEIAGVVSISDLLFYSECCLKSFESADKEDLLVDPLTGLYGERFFEDYLEMEIARSLRRGYRFCLLCMDVDQFQDFNALHGRKTGDALLENFAQLLKPKNGLVSPEFSIRRSDLVFRLKGDRFVLILPETQRSGAQVCAERLKSVTEKKLSSKLRDRKSFPVTISFGIAEFPSDSTQKEELLEKAENAIQAAKKNGTNRIKTSSA